MPDPFCGRPIMARRVRRELANVHADLARLEGRTWPPLTALEVEWATTLTRRRLELERQLAELEAGECAATR